MKNINISILTKKDIDGIKNWLTKNIFRENSCPMPHRFGIPFEEKRTCFLENKFCKHLFRKTAERNHCPCGCYSLKYVTKRAKHFIKEWEQNKHVYKK